MVEKRVNYSKGNGYYGKITWWVISIIQYKAAKNYIIQVRRKGNDDKPEKKYTFGKS